MSGEEIPRLNDSAGREVQPMTASTRRKRWVHATVLLGLGAFLLLGRSTSATIVGSAHDFSAIDPDQEICIFCHVTHGADTTVTDAPLWNHDVTNETYVLYNSPSLDASVGQPDGVSRLCLSCHDGTVAVDAYGDNPGSIFMGLPLAVGADELNNDHPVSFTYDDALATLDGELFPPSSSPSGLGSTIEDDMLNGGQLECSSCHDVHNGPAAAAVNDHLLIVTQVQSQLCLTCHNK
jgi:predicted CXXCH cytochrome family protein